MGETKPKKCQFCGRFFIPDPRIGDKQKACSRERCQKERKRLAQLKWCRKNPKYFTGRYEYVRDWRKNNRTSQDVQEASVAPVKKKSRKRRAGRKKGGNGNGWYKG